MRSLSTEEQDEALRLIYLVVKLRREGYSEGAIALETGYPSAPRLYQRMEELSCPYWTIYPEVSKKRRAWGNDPTSEEIPIADFMDRFEEGVRKLNDALEEVPYLKQWLKDGRFVSQLHYPKESGRHKAVFRKEAMQREGYPGMWEARCRKYGYDPDKTEVFYVPREHVEDRGADRHPDPYLVWLIAAYALTGGTLPDLPKVEEKREALLLAAKHLATAVLGGRVSAGIPPETISVEEQDIALFLQRIARRGVITPDGTVTDRDKWLPPSMQNYTSEEIRRLLSLQLPDARGGGA